MDADLFLEQFGHLADSPGGVGKLRNLILELAVRGRLVPQDPDDEPASELLKRIGRRSNKIPNPNSIPFLIPKKWEWTMFGVVLDLQGGSQPPKNTFVNEPRPGYIRLIQIRDLGANPVPVYVPQNRVSKFCEEGDVLIGRYGASIGKVFWAYRGAYNVALVKVLFDKDNWAAKYLFYYLKSSIFQELMGRQSRSAQAGFNKAEVYPTLVPLPPLAEQQRIVAKVDELMALCDQLEAEKAGRDHLRERATKSTLHHLTDAHTRAEARRYWDAAEQHFLHLFDHSATVADLRATILQLAVQGRLVPQNPADEPASDLLKRIEAEKKRLIKAGEIKPSKPLPPIREDEAPYEVPDGWVWVRAGSIVLKTSAGWSPNCLPRPAEREEWGVLKVSAVSWGRFDPSENKALPAEINPRTDISIRKNDFLVSRANTEELVGRAVVVEEDFPRLLLSDKTVRVVFASWIELSFALLVVNSQSTREYYKAVASGTSSSMKNISRQHILNISFPLPPLAEQQRIVAKVDELMALCDQLEAAAGARQALSGRLFDSVVHHLFESAG